MSLLRSWLITAPLIALATIICGSISLISSLFDSSGRKQAAMARIWSKILLVITGLDVKVEGLEKIPADGSFVFASNHLSYMDTPVVLANIPGQFRFLAKEGLFQIPFMGWHLTRAGHISVPREDARAAVKTMALAAEIIRTRGVSLLIFPEGGRTPDGLLHEFKDGAAYIAIRAGVPIIPITLIGTREVLAFGSGHFRPGPVIMRVGDPVETKNATLKDRTRVTQMVRDQVVAMSDGERAEQSALRS